jgi:hypothetical protein
MSLAAGGCQHRPPSGRISPWQSDTGISAQSSSANPFNLLEFCLTHVEQHHQDLAQMMPQQQEEKEEQGQQSGRDTDTPGTQEGLQEGSRGVAEEEPECIGEVGAGDAAASWLEAVQVAEKEGQKVGLASLAQDGLLGGGEGAARGKAASGGARAGIEAGLRASEAGVMVAAGAGRAAGAGAMVATGRDAVHDPVGGGWGMPADIGMASCISRDDPEEKQGGVTAGSQCVAALGTCIEGQRSKQSVSRREYQQRLDELLQQLETAEEKTGRFDLMP